MFDEYLDRDQKEITFSAQRGLLKTIKKSEQIFLDFPADEPIEQDINNVIRESVGANIQQLFKGRDDYLAILDNEASIRNISVNMRKVSELNARGLIVSALGDDYDFVSRCFYPKTGIDEDPVTGSAHCQLMPYWANEYKKTILTGRQLSSRGGQIRCELKVNRVVLEGTAVTFFKGDIYIPDKKI